MPAGAALIVKYPPRIHPTEKTIPLSECSVKLLSVHMHNVTCELDRATSTLRVYPMQVAVSRGEQIKVTVGDFNNPMTAGSDSFKIDTYTDKKFLNIIDTLQDGMVPGIKCNLPCLGCKGADDSDKCTSCYQDGSTDLRFLYKESCYATCPSELGYYSNS
jgi:hypothetical protein